MYIQTCTMHHSTNVYYVYYVYVYVYVYVCIYAYVYRPSLRDGWDNVMRRIIMS